MTTRDTLFCAAALLAFAASGCEENRTTPAPTPESKTTPAPPPAPVTNTNATITSDVLANATNKDRIQQPADEAKMIPARQSKIIAGFTVPLRSAPAGEWIASLETTAPITEVARDARGDYVLVLYTNPDDASKQLAGWVFKDAVDNTSWALQDTTLTKTQTGKPASTKEPALTCGKNQERMRTDHAFCAKACRDDGACDKSRSEICDGLAFEEHEGAAKMTTARYCVSGAAPAMSHPIN